MVYKEYKMAGYNLHTIKTDKFKQCHIEIVFRNNVKKEEITKRNLLFDILSEVNNEYQTRRELIIKLEELYNAQIYNVTSKVGNQLITNFCMDFISPEYIDEDISTNAIKLLFDMINNPFASNNEFDAKTFDFMKKRIKDEINSVVENPKKYALLEALKTLGDTPSSYNSVGYLEDLEIITPHNLYEYYLEVLKHDYIDIYIIGNLDMDKISKVIEEASNFNIIKNHSLEFYITNKKRKPEICTSTFPYAQTNLVMILNLNNLTEREKKYTANMFNIILGGGSLDTKLYQKLREQNSLCYNVSSSYQKYDSEIIIRTGISVGNEDKAIKLIKEALKEMQSKITDDEIEHSKELINTSISISMDNITKIVDNYFYQNNSDLDSFETRIETFKNITKEEIYELSKKISISTIYTLKGGA